MVAAAVLFANDLVVIIYVGSKTMESATPRARKSARLAVIFQKVIAVVLIHFLKCLKVMSA